MNSAYNKISPSLPIDSSKVKNLTEDEDEKTVEKLNLLLNSKTKLQKYFNDILNYIETKKMLRI